MQRECILYVKLLYVELYKMYLEHFSASPPKNSSLCEQDTTEAK